MSQSKLPPSSNYVIDIGLANILLNTFILIDESQVGDKVLLQNLALWVGVITMLMTMLDTIITLTLFIAMRDNQMQLGEVTFLKIMHLLRSVSKLAFFKKGVPRNASMF